MHYRGYRGVLEIGDDPQILFGRVVGIRDTITFQGATVEEAQREFERSVDVYLEFCASLGERPDQPDE
jgi:predicted HicB family RNase H-like nuclease